MVFMYFIKYFLCIFVYFLFSHRVFICVPSCTNFIINKYKHKYKCIRLTFNSLLCAKADDLE